MSHEPMNDSLYHTLFRLVTQGPQPVSNCVSVTGINEALKLNLVTVHPNDDVDWYHVTSGGIQTLLDAYDKRPDPEESIFGAIYIDYAERNDEDQLNGRPLHVLGGQAEWVRLTILGTVLRWSKQFHEYDYATFDFIHPVTEKVTHLKPGDWVILSEDGNHRVHKFSEVEDDSASDED